MQYNVSVSISEESNWFILLSDRILLIITTDEYHPERGYFYGGSSFGGNEFSMKFKLPPSLSGEKVLLQWFYYTANSCSPPGYYDYFAVKNTNLPSTFWGGVNLSTCTSEQFPGSKEFFTGDSP